MEFNEKETFYENIYIKKNKGGVLSMSPSFYLDQNYLSHNDINIFHFLVYLIEIHYIVMKMNIGLNTRVIVMDLLIKI